MKKSRRKLRQLNTVLHNFGQDGKFRGVSPNGALARIRRAFSAAPQLAGPCGFNEVFELQKQATGYSLLLRPVFIPSCG